MRPIRWATVATYPGRSGGLKDNRRRGVARLLLEAVEKEARELGCCKLTLEVQENNHAALALYRGFGFVNGQYEPEAGTVLFREKKL